MAVVEERPSGSPARITRSLIEPAGGRHQRDVAGQIVADSDRALTLHEAGYAPVHYFPPEDVDFARLEPTDHTSWCPTRARPTTTASPAGGERSVNAAWRYRSAFPAVAAIAGHIAFYRDRVDISA